MRRAISGSDGSQCWRFALELLEFGLAGLDTVVAARCFVSIVQSWKLWKDGRVMFDESIDDICVQDTLMK